MALPKISIVTPSYNQGPFIGWTVRSVLLQRYPNLEYIMMDGGSKDSTRKVLEPYADRFAHYVSEKDKGQADAIHRGFERATGDIMAYLNSDDVLAPGALQCVANYFAEHPEVDAVYSHRCTVDEHNKVLYYWILPRHNDWYMTRWDLIPQETCFWRRSLFEKAGNIDPSYRFAMDYDLFVRFMKHGKMVRLNRFLGAFRKHTEAKTSLLLETIGAEEVARVWKRYGLVKTKLDNLRSARFFNSVNRAGGKFAQLKRHLPGALPGINYDYDRVWGGLLRDPRLPPRNAVLASAAAQ
ncbi:MAG TPA: glycosyltransferase family 2 protein [Tepidisphaeraceae bacterium]|nr:glycosyltransferase family 2 protein [Tepidisphaeraceae bacterium]